MLHTETVSLSLVINCAEIIELLVVVESLSSDSVSCRQSFTMTASASSTVSFSQTTALSQRLYVGINPVNRRSFHFGNTSDILEVNLTKWVLR